MHAEFFLDTNILLYAASSARPEQRKRAKARELLAMEGGGLSYWDSAIIAAAVELGCQTIYSEDLNHGQSYAGVRVLNPFVE